MSRKKRELLQTIQANEKSKVGLQTSENSDSNHSNATEVSQQKGFWERMKGLSGIEKLGVIGLCLLLVVGVMGSGLGSSIISTLTGNKTSANSNNRNNSTNPTNPANAKNESLLTSLNPFAEAPPPSPTPQLSKEYIYAGSRMLAVEDAGATAAPPADLGIWRPASGEWWVINNQGSYVAQQWGMNGDIPVPGDFDGDGKTDFSIFRPSTNQWYVINSSNGATGAMTFGASGDKPAAADFDGDGRTDYAVFRPSDTIWYIHQSSTNTTVYQQFGISTDTPAPKDYDGDGRADIGVWRSSGNTFYSLNSSNSSVAQATFTQTSTEPVSADYDGDGRSDYAIRNSNNWIIKQSSNGQEITTAWEQATDKAVHNDYDGDGKVDIAVWRDSNGTWYIKNSSGNPATRTQQWGMTGDIPVPAFYRR